MDRVKDIILTRPPLHLRDKKAITDVNIFFPPIGIALIFSVFKKMAIMLQ